VILGSVEPAGLALRALTTRGASLSTVKIFNALPALTDSQGGTRPELLASLPVLGTETWQVFADGTMQTSYSLRPNLTWHDSEPLSGDDFVFAWQVYSSPELPFANEPPWAVISDVAAPDRDHFVIRWKVPYPNAAQLNQVNNELTALPRHILGAAFDQMATAGRDSLTNHPFWGPQYVGLGPYRVQEWERGSFINAVRFEGYALGVPKIARIDLRFSADQNVVVATLLAGEAQIATDSSIGQAVAAALEQEWARTEAGTVLYAPGSWRATKFQLRPDLANPGAVLDARVRKAMGYAVDKDTINDAAYRGKGILTDTPIWTGSVLGAAIDDSIRHFALDLRATDQLLNEAGFSKGPDGFYSGLGGRLPFELTTTGSPQSLQDILIMTDGFRSAGLDVQQRSLPAAQQQDGQARSTFPAMFTSSNAMGETALTDLESSQIPTANNRWVGRNIGGWSSADYDRLLQSFRTTLDTNSRILILRQALRVYSDEVPVISLVFPPGVTAYVAGLKNAFGKTRTGSNDFWNVYEWEFE
jgi:peptide/nickel transport system substrate-binding protein